MRNGTTLGCQTLLGRIDLQFPLLHALAREPARWRTTMLRTSHSTVGSYVRRAREGHVLAVVGRPGRPAAGSGVVSADGAVTASATGAGVGAGAPGAAAAQGVTLQLLWFEYREAHPDGYQYSRFCDRDRERRGRLDVVLGQVYLAGAKAFVNYAGPTVAVTSQRTGEVHGCQGVRWGAGGVEPHVRRSCAIFDRLPRQRSPHQPQGRFGESSNCCSRVITCSVTPG